VPPAEVLAPIAEAPGSLAGAAADAPWGCSLPPDGGASMEVGVAADGLVAEEEVLDSPLAVEDCSLDPSVLSSPLELEEPLTPSVELAVSLIAAVPCDAVEFAAASPPLASPEPDWLLADD
jgi:hypothetical protein